MTILEQVALAAIFYLINKDMLEWFLLIMSKEHTPIRFKSILSKDHSTLSCSLRKEGW